MADPIAMLTALFDLSQSALKLYEEAKAKAKADGELTDADENLLHAKEDAAMQSHPWKPDEKGGL